MKLILQFKQTTLFIILLILIVTSQFLKFQNVLKIDIDPNRITFSIHESKLSIPRNEKLQEFTKIKILSQQSTLSHSGLVKITNKKNNTNEEIILERNNFFLFGRFFTFEKSETKNNSKQLDFQDWSINTDDFSNEERNILIEKGSSQTLNFTFIGRGNNTIVLEGLKPVTFTSRDGFLDNDYFLCVNEKCDGGYVIESIKVNFLRIINFFIEFCILTTIILFFYNLTPSDKLENKTNVKKRKKKFILLSLATTAALHIFIRVYFQENVLGSIPHIPDSAIYLKQAKILMAGMIQMDVPPILNSLIDVLHEVQRENKLILTEYLHFWPAFIVPFLSLGIEFLANPIYSLIGLFFGTVFVFRQYGYLEAVLFSMMLTLSPLSILLSGDYMNHIFTQLLVIIIIFLIYCEKFPIVKLITIGIAGGIIIAIRPLTGISFAPWLCLLVYKNDFHWKKNISQYLWASLGFGLVMILMLIDQKLTSGSFFLNPYSKSGLSIGLHNLFYGLNYQDATLNQIFGSLAAWPLGYLISSFAIFALLIKRGKLEISLFGMFFTLALSHTLYNSQGLHGYGSRFMYESYFAIYMLSCSGIVLFFEKIYSSSKTIGYLFIATILILLVYWIQFDFKVLPSYVDYNGVKSNLKEQAKIINGKKSLILLKDQGWQGQLALSFVFDPSFTNSIQIKEWADSERIMDAISYYEKWNIYEFNGRDIKILKNRMSP
ncbi:MAG: hypothetical protein QE271_09370 [Bacteriovoracaceae bacterium]|nr:hypothetical protein [Bacteriovoracaceae bacterium]